MPRSVSVTWICEKCGKASETLRELPRADYVPPGFYENLIGGHTKVLCTGCIYALADWIKRQ